MPTESKTLTAEHVRKERTLASIRELQLHQPEGKLHWGDQVEQSWAAAILRLRDAMLAVPVKCTLRFADPKHAEAIIRAEVEIALRQLKGRA